MPRIKIKQSEQTDHNSVIIETGAKKKFTTGSSDEESWESPTNFETSTGEE